MPPRVRALCGLLATAVLALLSLSFGRAELGVGLKPDHLPDKAVRFASDMGLRGRVANAFPFGGYVIWSAWPETKVLADGRNEMVYPFSFVREVLDSQRDPKKFAELDLRFHFDWVLASNHLTALSHTFLARAPGWRMVYWSEAAVVYAREPLGARLASQAFEIVRPSSVDVSVANAAQRARRDPEIDRRLQAEIGRMLEASPQGLRSLSAYAIYCHFKGPALWPQRDETLLRLKMLHGDSAVVSDLEQKIRAP